MNRKNIVFILAITIIVISSAYIAMYSLMY